LLLHQNLRNEVVEQLQMFSSQLTVYKIEFTALGIFSFNPIELSIFVISVVRCSIVFELMKVKVWKNDKDQLV